MRIFGKQLLLYITTLAISFTFLGIALSQGTRRFLTEQRADELSALALRVARSMENFTEYGMFNLHLLGQEIQNIHIYTDATVVILDVNFEIFVSYGLPAGAVAQIYGPELAPVMHGESVVIFGTSNHPALQPLLLAAEPFWLGGEIAGAALVGFSMAELEIAVAAMYRQTFLALVLAALLAFGLIYASGRAILRPLRQISEAAATIAGGDFDKRITVRGKDEISHLAVQFNKMAEGLQEQDRIRNAFIANLSHDIRSPLTSMRGFLTAIADGTVSAEEQPYYLDIILNESERLIKLSNDILDLQKIEETALNRTTFDINELIRSTILGFSRRALEKHLMITSRFAHPHDYVEADEDKIRRVLYNLIDNAVKFTGEGGEIIIETTQIKNKVSVSVSDNGRGMTAEEQKYIFDRFYKGDTSRGIDKMGSGLGLSIVSAFVRAHNEQIHASSEIEKGSAFVFTLPIAAD